MSDDWDAYRLFLTLRQTGTVSGTAARLGVSRSTVVRQLTRLEARTSTPLFERAGDGYTLTSAGEALLPIAERLEAEAMAASRLLAGRDSRASGVVKMTIFEAGAPLIRDVIRGFIARHPAIDLHILTTNSSLSLQRREADVALRVTSAPLPSLWGRKLGRMEFAVYGTPDVIAQPNPPWVLWEEKLRAEGTWRLASEMGRPLKIAARVTSSATMTELCSAGVGVALMPVANARLRPELARLGAAAREGMGVDVWVLTHPDLRRAVRIKALTRWLSEHLPPILKTPC